MTVISPIVLLVFFFIFNWKLGLASMLPMMIGMILMSEMMTSEIKKMKDERTMKLELIIEKMSWLKTVSTSTAFFLGGGLHGGVVPVHGPVGPPRRLVAVDRKSVV